ncbi:MAG: phosphodiester glycosidase family protein [Acidimicrobiales bacterium]
MREASVRLRRSRQTFAGDREGYDSMLKRRSVSFGMMTGLCLSSVIALNSAGAARSSNHGTARSTTSSAIRNRVSGAPLPAPRAVLPFQRPALAGEGVWHPSGRLVHGRSAVYTTTVRLPGSSPVVAGIAWMDTRLLRATLYSGSLSPGGLFWKVTAPISPSASRTLVAAFNGGFLLKDTQGGYFSEGHMVAPLRVGGASLVIYRDGFATVGQWGRDVAMTPNVVAVRQNLTLLVVNGRPVAGLDPADTKVWGVTLNGVVNTPRSGLGVTANGALIYVSGPMNIVDLAQILVRAGAVRAMALDMNPFWPVFATFSPSSVNGLASPANGRDLLSTMYQPPGRFYEAAYNRDFITMSAK